MNVEWFAAQITEAKPGSGRALDRLNRLAAKLAPSPAGDPLFLPHLGGRVSPSQPDLRGCWAGLNWSHSAAHLYRAVLEGVALEYCLYRDALVALNPELAIREIRVTGGGQHSALWNQIKADALQTPVVQVTRREGSAAGRGLGGRLRRGPAGRPGCGARRWIETANTVRPAPALAAHYRSRLTRYQRLLDAMQQWSEPATENQP
jgi:xylulokinase